MMPDDYGQTAAFDHDCRPARGQEWCRATALQDADARFGEPINIGTLVAHFEEVEA